MTVTTVDMIENGTVVPITAIMILKVDGLAGTSPGGNPKEVVPAISVVVVSVAVASRGDGSESPTIELNKDGSVVVASSLSPKAV